MNDQVLADINALLAMLEREKAWPSQHARIEEIEARYHTDIQAMHERRMIAKGWEREGDGWSIAA